MSDVKMEGQMCDGSRVCPELNTLIASIRTLTDNVDKLGMQVSKIAEEMHIHDIHACNIESDMKKMRECNESTTLLLVQSQTRTQAQLEKLVFVSGENQKAERDFYQKFISVDQAFDRRLLKKKADVDSWVIKKRWVIFGGIITTITTILILIAEYYFGV